MAGLNSVQPSFQTDAFRSLKLGVRYKMIKYYTVCMWQVSRNNQHIHLYRHGQGAQPSLGVKWSDRTYGYWNLHYTFWSTFVFYSMTDCNLHCHLVAIYVGFFKAIWNSGWKNQYVDMQYHVAHRILWDNKMHENGLQSTATNRILASSLRLRCKNEELLVSECIDAIKKYSSEIWKSHVEVVMEDILPLYLTTGGHICFWFFFFY